MVKPLSARRVSLTVSLDVEQLAMIDNYASEYDLTVSEAVRELLDKGRSHELMEKARSEMDAAPIDSDQDSVSLENAEGNSRDLV